MVFVVMIDVMIGMIFWRDFAVDPGFYKCVPHAQRNRATQSISGKAKHQFKLPISDDRSNTKLN